MASSSHNEMPWLNTGRASAARLRHAITRDKPLFRPLLGLIVFAVIATVWIRGDRTLASSRAVSAASFESNSLLLPCSAVSDTIARQQAFTTRVASEFRVKYEGKRARHYQGSDAAINPWDYRAEIYLWDWFIPLAPCELRERVGIIGDGGKFVCDVHRYAERPNCVIYSFGVRGDSSFEAEMHRRTKDCHIFGFDFSVGGMAGEAAGLPRISFMQRGIGPAETADPPLWTLTQIMAHYGHTFIDILKVDVEGAEFEVFAGLFKEFEGSALPFEQLLLEIHHPEKAPNALPVFQLLHGLADRGVLPYMNEVNHNPSVMLGAKPGVIEYSFYNTRYWWDASRWACRADDGQQLHGMRGA